MADLTVSLVGDEVPQPSEVQESSFDSDFFSYDDKYISDGGAQIGEADKKIIIPANVDESVQDEVRQMAVNIFAQFELSGIARIDFLFDRKEEKLYANEINTMPGTLYKHLWEESGVTFAELLRNLIRTARRRHSRKQDTSYTFDSDILTHAGKGKLGKLSNEEANN